MFLKKASFVTKSFVPYRCFKPNFGKSPEFDDSYMVRQLRYTGVLQIVQARQEGFSYRIAFAEFLRR